MLTKSQTIAVIALKGAIRAITEAPENEEKEKCDTDWSKVQKGTLVEVRHEDNDAWIPGYFLGYEPNPDYSYYIKASSLEEEWYGYKECRLYEGPR